jgi:hypothetical protein
VLEKIRLDRAFITPVLIQGALNRLLFSFTDTELTLALSCAEMKWRYSGTWRSVYEYMRGAAMNEHDPPHFCFSQFFIVNIIAGQFSIDFSLFVFGNVCFKLSSNVHTP